MLSPSTLTTHICMMLVALVSLSRAESHAVTFTNNCGRGTPTIIQSGNTLNSGGGDYTSSGDLSSIVIYLQDGTDTHCGTNGDECTILECTLKNGGDGATGCDVSLIPDHEFTVGIGFSYTGGCVGQGAACGEDGCDTAYYSSGDSCAMVNCSEDNVGIDVTFCGVTTGFNPAKSGCTDTTR